MKDEATIEDVIDVEEYAKSGKPVPKGKSYRLRVDKVQFVHKESTITGRSVLELAGKLPVDRYRLDLKLKGGATRKVSLEEVVDLTLPGVERFLTVPLDQTEG